MFYDPGLGSYPFDPHVDNLWIYIYNIYGMLDTNVVVVVLIF
jgi:hypothetical protein